MDITLRDLQEMRAGITGDMRHDLDRVETNINARIEELKDTQKTHAERIAEHQEAFASLKAAVETASGDRRGLLDLSRRQRKWLAGAAGTLVLGSLEGLGHIAYGAFAWLLHALKAKP